MCYMFLSIHHKHVSAYNTSISVYHMSVSDHHMFVNMYHMLVSVYNTFVSVCHKFVSVYHKFVSLHHMSVCTTRLSVCIMCLSVCTTYISMCTMCLSVCTTYLSVCTTCLSGCITYLSARTTCFVSTYHTTVSMYHVRLPVCSYLVLDIAVAQLQTQHVLKGLAQKLVDVEMRQLVTTGQHRYDEVVDAGHGHLGDAAVTVTRCLGNHNNNNNSYIALYPVNIYKLAAHNTHTTMREGLTQTPSVGLRHPSFNHCRI